MIRTLVGVAIVGTVLAAQAGAQGAPKITAVEFDAQDRAFIHDAAVGGVAEVSLGDLAAKKGDSPEVRNFGHHMVVDHSKANQRLAALAKADGIALPPAPDQEHRTAQDQLATLGGPQFDQTYIKLAVDDHQKAVQLFERESASGTNPGLKSFAGETLPTIKHHLAMAQGIATDLDRATPQASRRGAPVESSGSSMARGSKAGDHSADELNREELQRLKGD